MRRRDELLRRARAEGLHGMTLLEIMIVIAILGLLARGHRGRGDEPVRARKVKTAKLKIKSIEQALHQYNIDYQGYPSQGEGLRALISPPDGGRAYSPRRPCPRTPGVPSSCTSPCPLRQRPLEGHLQGRGRSRGLRRRREEQVSPVKRAPRHQRRRGSRGLTLLELIIVMGILILMVGISVVGLNRMSSVQLRTQTNKLAAAIRHTYNRSVAHGLYMRMVIDIERDAYWVEASERPVFLPSEKMEEGQREEEQLKAQQELEDADDDEKKQMTQRQQFQQDGVIPRVAMERGVGVSGVLTSSQKEVFESGEAHIHFFPNGFVEPSIIYTTDGAETYNTLIVNPLTGKVTWKPGKVDPDRQFGEPEEVEEEGR